MNKGEFGAGHHDPALASAVGYDVGLDGGRTMGEMGNNDILIYQAGDGTAVTEVRLDAETVWLTQAQMVALFGRDQSVISRHLGNVFKEGELDRESNMQKMHIAHSAKPIELYNLDVIISVGYRVKSVEGTRFRQWATRVLREHLTQGYTLNRPRLGNLARVVDRCRALVFGSQL